MGGVLALSCIGRLSPFRARETARDTWVALTGKPLVRRLRTAACNEGVGPPFFSSFHREEVRAPSRTPLLVSPATFVYAPGFRRETRAIGAWAREHVFSGSPAPRRAQTSLARAPRPRPFRPFFLRFFSGLLKVPGWRRGKEGRGSCPVPPRLWLRRPIPRPRTDPSGFLTRRVNQTSSNPASFGLDTGDASDLRDRRLTPRDFRHPRGSPTARLFETVRVPARAKV